MLSLINSEVSGYTIYGLDGNIYNVPLEHADYALITKELNDSSHDADSLESRINDILNAKTRKVKDFSGVDFEIVAGELLFRGKPYENKVFTKMLFDSIDKGCKPGPLIRFLEKVEMNPNPKSVEQLWLWLSNAGLAVSDEGDIIGFKYVTKVTESSHPELFKEGAQFTDGYTQTMNIRMGVPVEMPRNKVVFNPASSCSAGLHVGIFSYAKNAANAILVKVNPADVVSVPNSEYCKVRCCRYTPIRKLTAEEKSGNTELIGSNGFKLPSIEIKDIVPASVAESNQTGWLDNQCNDYWEEE